MTSTVCHFPNRPANLSSSHFSGRDTVPDSPKPNRSRQAPRPMRTISICWMNQVKPSWSKRGPNSTSSRKINWTICSGPYLPSPRALCCYGEPKSYTASGPVLPRSSGLTWRNLHRDRDLHVVDLVDAAFVEGGSHDGGVHPYSVAGELCLDHCSRKASAIALRNCDGYVYATNRKID